MLKSVPTPYSPDAADAADRLRLLACDLRLADAAVQAVVVNEDDQQATRPIFPATRRVSPLRASGCTPCL
jgi:hypothetical protein